MAGCGELVAETRVVEEQGDVALGFPARNLAQEEVGQFWPRSLIDLGTERRFLLLDLTREIRARGADYFSLGRAYMGKDHIRRSDDFRIELEAGDTSHMLARLKPVRGKHRLHAVGGA